MKRKLTAASAEIIVTEPLPLDDLEDNTVEEYKKLNENLGKVMSKIKNRKEHKRKK